MLQRTQSCKAIWCMPAVTSICITLRQLSSLPAGRLGWCRNVTQVSCAQTNDEQVRSASKRKWFEDLKKSKEQELEKLGLESGQVRSAMCRGCRPRLLHWLPASCSSCF